MSNSIYKIKGSELIDEKARTKIGDIKNVAKSGSYKDLDLTGATINTNYTLPNSSDNTLGGVKIGENLSISNHGVLSTPIIDESLHKTSIQLTKDRKQIININDGDTIILPDVSGEELLTIDVEINIPWNSEHKSPTVTFPTDIKWVENPRLKFDSWYNYRFMYVKDQWLGGFTEFDVVYDSNVNVFIIDTSKTAGNLTLTLNTNMHGDTTNWDKVTDWGDGIKDTNTTHTYTNDGIYMVKTKYNLSGNAKLINCLSINKNMTNMDNMFSYCSGLTTLEPTNWDTSNVKSMFNTFSHCINLTKLDLNNLDTSNVTNMQEMIRNNTNLTTLNINNLNTSKLKNMSNIFCYCSNLTALDLSNWDTSNVTDMNGMFLECGKMKNLNISNFNTSNVTNMSYMFRGCNSINTLDLSNWDTSNVTNMGYMFFYCTSLYSLNISNFNMDKVTNTESMLKTCGLHRSGLTMTNCNEATKTKINSMVPA